MDVNGPNAEQVRYWNESVGSRWAAEQAVLDATLAPFGAAAMAALRLEPTARVLDVGCGCGGTTLELATRVVPQGSVTGVDISEPMLARARERAAAVPNVRFERADAQTHTLPSAAFDAVFSRFGVMFFAEPVAAFANIGRALRPGGQLAFACWQELRSNAWMLVPLMAAAAHLTLPPPAAPEAPGPFAFASRDRVQAILAGAGFTDVTIEPFEPAMRLGNGRLDDAIEFVLQLGPLAQAMRDADPAVVPRVHAALREALLPYDGPDGIRLPSAAWIVTARRA